MKNAIKNAIIMNGVCHVMVDNNYSDGCKVCSLKFPCHEILGYSSFCDAFEELNCHFEINEGGAE